MDIIQKLVKVANELDEKGLYQHADIVSEAAEILNIFAQGFGMGPGGVCTCPQCGKEMPHETGVPCFSTRCPECDVPMIRKEAVELMKDICQPKEEEKE